MTVIYAIIAGIVEGLTEFLPISSTGHLILVSHLLSVPSSEFLKSFQVIIQLGAILAVVVLYWKTLTSKLRIWIPIIIAFIPTGILGLIFEKKIDKYLLDNSLVVLISLFTGGIILIALEFILKNKARTIATSDNIPCQKALIIGLFQSVAMVPGVSRSAATIIGSQLLGLSKETAVEFSFFLAIPTMFAATGLKLFQARNLSFTSFEYELLIIGLIVSFITALIAVKFFIGFIKKHNFIPFGIYRIIVAIIFWFFLVYR
jgi:undecaprenyl-diphosphatase